MQRIHPIVSLPLNHPTFWGHHDTQQDPPAGWCAGCGMEVYEEDEILCPDCREEKENEKLLQ